ncbi:TPA: MerR family transcriptional regulator [Streptococcus suis]|nr:MerR family transcriptional regulator [Streptococcus suis]
MVNILSREAELELLEKVDRHLERRLELEREHLDNFDLIPVDEVEKKLAVTSTTLRNWEKAGLQRYQSPFESSKKIYYRATDLYRFLAVD